MTDAPSVIRVAAEQPYDVLVGNGIAAEVGAMLGPDVPRVAVIQPPSLATHTSGLAKALSAAGYEVHGIPVPEGEAAKTAEVAASCWAALGRLRRDTPDAAAWGVVV